MEHVSKAHATAEEIDLERLSSAKNSLSGALEGKTPAEKWNILFKIHSEQQQKLEEKKASNLLQTLRLSAKHRDDSESVDSERAKLRGSIHLLKQKSHLSERDELRLADLQARLKALN